MRIICLAALSLILATGPTLAAGAQNDKALFGRDPGKDRAFACFSRQYDAGHLSQHKEQNVTAMTLLVDSANDADYGRQYAISIGVNFRAVDEQFQVSGSCGVDEEGNKLLGCGIDCDGGQIDVKLRDADSIAVEIPYGARTWDPQSEGEPPAEAAFGPDDKVFWLYRTDLKNCLPLEYDDAGKALLAAQ
jgi:hypothetical protein